MIFLVLSLYWFPHQRMRNRCAMSNVSGPALPASTRLPRRCYLRKIAASKKLLLQAVAIRERNDRKVMPRTAAGFAVVSARVRTAKAAPAREKSQESKASSQLE